MTDNMNAMSKAAMSGETLYMTYKNWKGKTARREIRPVSLRFGTTDWHLVPGWLLLAWDVDKAAVREFALADCDFLSENGGA